MTKKNILTLIVFLSISVNVYAATLKREDIVGAWWTNASNFSEERQRLIINKDLSTEWKFYSVDGSEHSFVVDKKK